MFTKFRLFGLLLLVVIGITAVSCKHRGSAAGKKIEHIVLISIDTCRADHLGCYGFERATTPNIDAVADGAILFENVVSPVPLTLPAHCSMLTGTIPVYHGVHTNAKYRLDNSNMTLAEILGQNGFATGAIVSSVVLDSTTNINQGFGSYNDRFENPVYEGDFSERVGEETSRLAIEWLDEHRDDRFFLFLHYYDPHTTYEPPEPYRVTYADNLYAGEIAYTDYCIGQVIDKLKSLGIYDSSLLIITGDHGEMLGEHGEIEHGYFIYQGAVKVPLIIKPPGERKRSRVKELAGLIDIVPTVCGLVGIEPPGRVQGIDLSKIPGGKSNAAEKRFLYCESLYPTQYNANSLLGVVGERYKYIQTTRPELYDIVADGLESNNVITELSKQGRVMQEQLKVLLFESIRIEKEPSGSSQEMDASTRRQLESLGYTGGTGIEDFDFEFDQSKDDPKDVLEFHLEYQKALRLDGQGKYSQVIGICEELIRIRPGYHGSYVELGKVLTKMGKSAEAVKYYRKAIELMPYEYKSYNNLGTLMTGLGRLDEAAGLFKQALRFSPQNAEVLYGLGQVLLRQGNTEPAADRFSEALKHDPKLVEAHYSLANILLGRGKVDEAIEHYNEMLPLTDKKFLVHNQLAFVFLKQNKPSEAVKHLKQSLGLKPEQPEVLKTLASIYAGAKKFPQAIKAAQLALELAVKSNQKELITEIQKQLELYRASRK